MVRFLRAYVKACEFFYEPKNKEAAVHALAERTKADERRSRKNLRAVHENQKTDTAGRRH